MRTSPTPTREAPHAPAPPGTPVQRQQVAPPRPEQLRTADSPRTPIPAQRVPEAPNSLPEQPQPDAPKISTSDSMAAETPPKDQWQAGHHMVDHTPRLDLSPDLRNKLGTSVRDIEATGAGLSFTKPPVKDYYGRADWAHKRPRCSVDPNRFTVEMHGSPNGVKFKGNHLDAKELAEIIRGSAGYKNGTPVRLVSCETGADVPDGSKNFAQQLSEELGVEVLAPNTNAWVDNYGNIYANESSAKFDKNEPGTPKPRLDSPGEWTAFRPDGTKAVHSSPYPPGHQPEWVRHGIQAEGARMRGIFGRRKDEDFSTDPVTGHNFSNAPPPGQYSPPQGQHAPPQGPYGPPQPQFSPQGHFPQQGHLPRGQHPGQVQGSPQQGQRFSPQGQGSPQQGYLQQGAQGYGLQSHPPANPAQQPRPQPNAVQQHYSNTPHHGKQHPSASHGYPQHSPRQGQPQHHSQQGGHPVHAQRPPQAPQQGVHLPPQPHPGGYAPPPQQAAPPRPPQQQQGHPLHGGQPNAFSPSGRTPPQNVAQNAPAPASGGYTPQRQPAQGHAPKAAAPAPSPAAPAASGQPHTPWNSTTPQSPSGPAHQSPPAQASSPAPKAQGPEPTSAPKRPVGGNPTSQPAQAGHGPSAAPAQQTDVPRSAGHQPHDAGSAAPHAPTTASKPALGDFAPTQSGTLSGADAPADASWKSDFDPAGESKTSDGSADPESATTSKPVLEDVDRGPAHSEASHTSSHVEESVAPKAQTDAMTQASPATTNADKTFADVEPSKPDHGLDAASSSGSAHEPSGPDEFGSGTHKQHGDDQPDAVSEDHGPKGVAALDGETTIGAQSPERVDRDELLQQIADPSFRADHETLKSVESYYENHPLGLDLEQTLQLQIDRYLSDLRSRDPEFAARIDQMSHTERLQVHAYTRTFYEELNSALRSGDPEALGRQRERIEVLSAALNQIPDVSCKAHRTVTTNNPVFAQAIADGYEPGSVITEPAYTSTSVREDPANPGEPKSKFGGLVEFHMDLKTGKDVRLFNPNGGEAEILVPAGAAFKVVDKWHDGKVWHIKLEQVHPDDLPSGGLPPAPNVDYTPPNPEPMGGTGSDIGKLLSGDFG